MYFSIGWPRVINCSYKNIRKIACDRVKILFTILTDDTLAIWYTKPCVPIAAKIRSAECVEKYGHNTTVEWKPDSSMLLVVTTSGTLFMYTLIVSDAPRGVYNQNDSPFSNLRRDSAELFLKETIPSLRLSLTHQISLYVPISCISCINVSQIMVATKNGRVIRLNWNGVEERDYALDLKRIPFSINQQVSYAVPILESNTFIESIDYSPLLCGFAITLNDGRAAFLTAGNTKFDPNQVQGIWCQNVDDATCCVINHKYRLIAFGRRNSQTNMYVIDDLAGGLELSHRLVLSAKDFPGAPGHVSEIKWTPDGCAIMVSWSNGGISLWSTFGSLLMCSLGWDYGLHVDLSNNNPFNIISMDWSTEGYQLFMVRQLNETIPSETCSDTVDNSGSSASLMSASSNTPPSSCREINESVHKPTMKQSNCFSSRTMLIQLDFVKSILTINPCMSYNSYLLLQGDDKLYINHGDVLQNIYHNANAYSSEGDGNAYSEDMQYARLSKSDLDYMRNEDDSISEKYVQINSILSESKHWVVLNLPTAYTASNWPVRYSAIDFLGTNVAVAGRTGVALYSFNTRKWKLFGNETQEKDFVVTGGLLWWNECIIMGCYSLIGFHDELRIYSKDNKLDNRFASITKMNAPVMLINLFKDQLIVFTADGHVTIFLLVENDSHQVELEKMHIYDIKNVCIHPACVISVLMTNLRNEIGVKANYDNSLSETLILNVSGRVLMVQTDYIGNATSQLASTCLASSVECIWVSDSNKTHIKESLWLYCGGHGMRVWLPVFPRNGETGTRSHRHTFMSKRIMLSFTLKIYPLVILFEDAIILGAENDTVLYTSDSSVYFSLPYCSLKRTSQVYLHQILRQLIRRNLGYNAWEIARCCTNLPYFPHSLELLLHEVLEEEATSKDPIPDALLPSVLEFIQEFPVYLETVVQCARKTEIALWPYLFSSAGKPKELFQQCMSSKQLQTAASYLIILQNLEPSAVSRQYATLLLDTALEQRNWLLAKDLVRFLRAIDPNDVESPRSSYVFGTKFGLNTSGPPVSPNAEDLSLILGSSMTRGRSFSTTVNPKSNEAVNNATIVNKEKNIIFNNTTSSNVDSALVQKRKKSVPNTPKEKDSSSAEDFFIDVILQRHARRFLQLKNLEDLGRMSATLDFHLVGWLTREKDRAARIEDFVLALKALHDELDWPKPCLDLNLIRNGPSCNQPESPASNVSNKSTIDVAQRTEDSGYNSLSVNRIPEGAIIDEKSNIKTLVDPLIAMTIAKLEETTHEVKELSFIDTKEANLSPMNDNISVRSDHVIANWTDDGCGSMNLEIEESFNRALENITKTNSRSERSQHKLEIKMRYLLQIFTEANCYEFSLLLSVLLLDVASVCRITNAAIRSKSLVVCRQLRNGLKDMTRWSFNECLGYRPFMIAVQPQLAVLDKFVIQQEAIPSLTATTNTSVQYKLPTAANLSDLGVISETGSTSVHSGNTESRHTNIATDKPDGRVRHMLEKKSNTVLEISYNKRDRPTSTRSGGNNVIMSSSAVNIPRHPGGFVRSVSDLEVKNIRKMALGKSHERDLVHSSTISEESERSTGCVLM
ncbi:guanine nucleotide exchange factor subunit Rich isoform X1 [Topomyia yanbarensis]|uniref:guanine nucleotide exchange factor subunit Rich isoform X1 n=1 Tax=Topomyia yanbarensis TaxID=2498891 RepID=UPI00273B91D5|nr:guanine nucleotide exchange factor subunit Rich isoform X1 [Topomyia yanbarensis]